MAQHGHKRGTYLVAEKQHIVLEMKVSVMKMKNPQHRDNARNSVNVCEWTLVPVT
jgi:hypothetical protein